MKPRLAEVLALEGTAYGNFALGAAAQRADVTVDAGTTAAWPSYFTNLAEVHGDNPIVT